MSSRPQAHLLARTTCLKVLTSMARCRGSRSTSARYTAVLRPVTLRTHTVSLRGEDDLPAAT